MGLLDQLKATAEAVNWEPKPGDGIEGTIVAVATRLGYQDTPYPAVTLSVTDGTTGAVRHITIHAFHSTLKTDLLAARPQSGDQLAVVYLGLKKPRSGKGRDYHAYQLAHEPHGPRINAAAEAMPELPGDPF